ENVPTVHGGLGRPASAGRPAPVWRDQRSARRRPDGAAHRPHRHLRRGHRNHVVPDGADCRVHHPARTRLRPARAGLRDPVPGDSGHPVPTAAAVGLVRLLTPTIENLGYALTSAPTTRPWGIAP